MGKRSKVLQTDPDPEQYKQSGAKLTKLVPFMSSTPAFRATLLGTKFRSNVFHMPHFVLHNQSVQRCYSILKKVIKYTISSDIQNKFVV